MEHVLLAFVRWQDVPSNESSGSLGDGPTSAASLGVPRVAQKLNSGLPSHAPGMSHSIKEARQASTSPWSPHGARCQRKAECPHVYTRPCQDCCKLAYSISQRGDSHTKCIRTISRLGASGSTDTQADAAICRPSQEAHGPSP